MPHSLQFDVEHSYFSNQGGIWLPTFLTVGVKTVECEANVDTGAEFCIFQRELADRLGLNLEKSFTSNANAEWAAQGLRSRSPTQYTWCGI